MSFSCWLPQIMHGFPLSHVHAIPDGTEYEKVVSCAAFMASGESLKMFA